MKRITLRQHRYVNLVQTKSDTGQPVGFEIRRPKNWPVGLIKSFNSDQENHAHLVFETLAFLMELYGPGLPKTIKNKILTGRG